MKQTEADNLIVDNNDESLANLTTEFSFKQKPQLVKKLSRCLVLFSQFVIRNVVDEHFFVFEP